MVRCEASSGPAGQPFLALLNVWDVREVYGECQLSIIHQLSADVSTSFCLCFASRISQVFHGRISAANGNLKLELEVLHAATVTDWWTPCGHDLQKRHWARKRQTS